MRAAKEGLTSNVPLCLALRRMWLRPAHLFQLLDAPCHGRYIISVGGKNSSAVAFPLLLNVPVTNAIRDMHLTVCVRSILYTIPVFMHKYPPELGSLTAQLMVAFYPASFCW